MAAVPPTRPQPRWSTSQYRSEYSAWGSAKQRCFNPKAIAYADYGGRGITMCERWLESFEHFMADMGPKPGPEYSLDRINPDGNYEPGNCRWGTPEMQARNTRQAVAAYERLEQKIDRLTDLVKLLVQRTL